MDQITATTKITGIIGYPISHTLSPLMHNRAFSLLGLDFVYVVFPVPPDNLRQAIKALPALRVRGINVTIPYKQSVLPLLDKIDKEAKMIGAVNIVLIENERLVGYNSDGYGFITSLIEAGFNPKGKKVLLLGAGGACRAVFMALGWSGAKKISVAARKIDKAEQLIREGKLYIESKTECVSLSHIPVQTLKEASLIVNTTPIGMYPYENNLPPIAFELLQPTQYICDLIYNPLETQFLAKAKLKGCKVVNGVGMLVHQGAKTFSLFTDKKAPIEEMRQVVLDYVSKSRKVLP